MPQSERVKLLTFNVSFDAPGNHLSYRHGDICLGWIPWRALKVWGGMKELPEKLEDQFATAGMCSIDSREYASFTGEWTPFHGFQLAQKSVKELARVYMLEEQDMKYLIWGNLILLRNIFFGRFGEDACKWWEHIQAQLHEMRSQGLPADAFFFLTDVAFCEICHREHLIREGQQREKGLMKIVSALESLREEKDLQNWFFVGLLVKLSRIAEHQKKRFERWKSVMRFDEPEGYSPILHLVNTKIVEILIQYGLGVNQACKSAARLYLGFDLFGHKPKAFRFDRLQDGNRRAAIEREIVSRSKRVKRCYYTWKDRIHELVERVKFDYRGSGMIVV